MNLLRILLYPFACIYGIVMLTRNKLYDWNVLSSQSFNIPVISVGNLTVGGTGKTPQVEYIIRILLKKKYRIATLSRGYKRKTKGFVLAKPDSTYTDIGDEPLQYKNKFKDIVVAVDEKRVRGIKKLLGLYKDLDVILLDDAYQHRSVKPGFSILLTDYHNLYKEDYILPTGKLREPRCGAKRADMIVVTKTPSVFSPLVQRELISKLKPKKHQNLFYSYISYELPLAVPGIKIPKPKDEYNTILMFSGIANPYPLQEHLKTKCFELIVLDFPDHHKYTSKDLEKITSTYDEIFSVNKCIITTEKDAMRLIKSDLIALLKDYPVYHIPIETKFHKTKNGDPEKLIVKYVEGSKKSQQSNTPKN